MLIRLAVAAVVVASAVVVVLIVVTAGVVAVFLLHAMHMRSVNIHVLRLIQCEQNFFCSRCLLAIELRESNRYFRCVSSLSIARPLSATLTHSLSLSLRFFVTVFRNSRQA